MLLSHVFDAIKVDKSLRQCLFLTDTPSHPRTHQLMHTQVTKINTSGFKQGRILMVDPTTYCLWNFNQKMQLRKQLPLTQLVQVGAPLLDSSCVFLCTLAYMPTCPRAPMPPSPASTACPLPHCVKPLPCSVCCLTHLVA